MRNTPDVSVNKHGSKLIGLSFFAPTLFFFFFFFFFFSLPHLANTPTLDAKVTGHGCRPKSNQLATSVQHPGLFAPVSGKSRLYARLC